MVRAAKIAALVMLASALCGGRAAAADCEIISATHSAATKGEALKMSQALAAQSAERLKETKGWRRVSVTAQQVKPDPFWKSVRRAMPEVEVYATFVTPKTYTICFAGVVVRYVCTSGSKVCGN